METASAALDISSLLKNPWLKLVNDAAKAVDGKAWLVGGAIRDCLLTGELPLDLDFTLVDCSAEKLAQQLAGSIPGHLVALDPVFGIHRVVLADGLQLDLADALQNDLDIDLARRDLTVNAMALDLETGELLDPFAGRTDLKCGQIRMLSEANLLDDPLRLLRVFRVAASIQAKDIDPATLTVVQNNAAKIWDVAPERIHYELFRLFNSERCFPSLQAMAETGLLEVLIPALTPMKTIAASGFHHLGLFDHTMELVRQAERLLPECPPKTQAWLRAPFNGVVSRMGLVKLGSLLHDIGKPATMGTREDAVHGTRLTFYGHEEVGEEMADPWLRKMKVSNEIREHVKFLIRWHLYPCQFGPDSLRRSVLRYYRRMGDATLDVTMLALADRHSSCGEWITPEAVQVSHEAHLWLMDNYHQEQSNLKAPRLLGGHDVMRLLGYKPGPMIKIALDALQEAQQLAEVSNREEAEHWLLANRAHFNRDGENNQ
jgi:putative nucleotidyltransferase with HDIG domain